LVSGQFPALVADGRAMIEQGNSAGEKLVLAGYLNSGLTVFVVMCVCTVQLWAISRWIGVWLGKKTAKPQGGA